MIFFAFTSLNSLCMFLNSLCFFASELTMFLSGCGWWNHRPMKAQAVLWRRFISLIGADGEMGTCCFLLALVTVSSHGCGPLSRACCLLTACIRWLALLSPKIYGCILNENYIWNQFYQFPGRWQGENMWKMSFHHCWFGVCFCPLSPIASSFLIIWPWENVFTQ